MIFKNICVRRIYQFIEIEKSEAFLTAPTLTNEAQLCW